MDKNATLYLFLTTKLKERGLPVESLPKLLGISRSTLYRNMKGVVRMSDDVQARFAELLKLEDEERQQYDRLSGLAAFDQSLIEARYVLDRFVFAGTLEEAPAKKEPIRFALYDSDTYLRTADEIYGMVRELIGSAANTTSATAVDIQIINCTADRPFQSLATLIESLFALTQNISVEHLLTLPSSDYLATITAFTRMVPLLRHERYTVRYADAAMPPLSYSAESPNNRKTTPAPAMFNDSVGITINTHDGIKYFFIAFIEDDLSTCLVTSDQNAIAFFQSNFVATQKNYREALVDYSNIDLLSDALADLEENVDAYIIKPNFCFDRIPENVFQSVLARSDTEELVQILNKNAATAIDFGSVLDGLNRRLQATYKNRHVDVYSKLGLSEFTKTGRTSDHIDGLPSFSPKERKMVYEYILARYRDPDDSYDLFITHEDFLTDGCIIIVLEDTGILLEYNAADYRRGICSNLFIDNQALIEVFSDYIRNHIPCTRALSHTEADAFLVSQIESLEE